MSPAARSKSILPWWQIGLVLAACAAGIWFLLPDDSKLIDSLLRDGESKEARRLLEKVTPAARARDAAHFRFLDVRVALVELNATLASSVVTAPAQAAALDRFWREATTAWRETQFSGAIFLEFTPFIPRLSDPAAAWSFIAADFPRATEKQRTRLAEDFVRATLAASQTVAAAEIFSLAHPLSARPPDDSLELSRLWQLAGRPTDALAALGDSPSPAAAARRVALLRELNRNREALVLLRTRADSAASLDATAVDELATVALAAGEPAAAAPYVQRFLETHPRDLSAHRRLRALHLAAGNPSAALPSARQAADLSKPAPDDLRDLARILEFSNQPAAAFDTWLAFALAPAVPAPDRLGAIDRLLALNPGLYRDADLVRALEPLVPVSERPDYTLRLARLDVSLGLFAEARAAFERYLAVAPADVDALIEFAHLNNDLNRFAESEALLRRASTLRPAELTLRREIGESLVAQGRNADALALFATLAQLSDAEEILGPYIRLAESLGRYDDFTRGLRRRIDRSAVPVARDYVLLAYGFELADDPVRRQATLDEGLRRAAQSDDLRLQLAFALSAEKKYTAAQAALAPHAGLRADTTAATLFLKLLRLNNDTAAERRYLAEPLAPALAHDEAILERIARAREALREFAEAERLWRELHELRPAEFDYTAALARVLLTRGHAAEANRLLAPFLVAPTPAMLKLAAEISEATGDHRAAEKYQLAYLDAVRTAPATDWGALGDIRLSRGDRPGAKLAYAEALRRLHREIALTEGKE